MKHLIVIDDTGSPGNTKETRFLKDDRKTLVGVFIDAEIRSKLEKMIEDVISILNKQFGITELHFTDLINKRNQFSMLETSEVLILIQLFSSALASLPLPFFVQTVHKNTLKENGLNNDLEFESLKLNKNEDAALLLLLLKIKKYLEKEYPNQIVEFVIDEGRRKKGTFETFESLGRISIEYKSSNDFKLLQVADFFAYSINRMQMTSVKENKTDFDKLILSLLSLPLSKQFSEGVSKIEVDLDEFSEDDYDYEQRAVRERDGNLDQWEKSQERNETKS